MIATVAREIEAIRKFAHPVLSDKDYEPLIELAGAAQFVLIGEASHGTHEFYGTRATLTRRLIAEKGFRAVALEADWQPTGGFAISPLGCYGKSMFSRRIIWISGPASA